MTWSSMRFCGQPFTRRVSTWVTATAKAKTIVRPHKPLCLGAYRIFRAIFSASPHSYEHCVEIKTASWYTKLPDGHARIGISRGTPRGMAAGYRMYRKLAPDSWFNSVGAEEYDRLYRTEILDRLDSRIVAADLVAKAGGQIPVMLCFERPRSWPVVPPSLSRGMAGRGLGPPGSGGRLRDAAAGQSSAAAGRTPTQPGIADRWLDDARTAPPHVKNAAQLAQGRRLPPPIFPKIFVGRRGFEQLSSFHLQGVGVSRYRLPIAAARAAPCASEPKAPHPFRDGPAGPALMLEASRDRGMRIEV
jgi:hypothetical protein